MDKLNFDFLTGENTDFVLQLACRYSQSRESVDRSWLPFLDSHSHEIDDLVAEAKIAGKFGLFTGAADNTVASCGEYLFALREQEMVRAFRSFGHKFASLDALRNSIPSLDRELMLETYLELTQNVPSTHVKTWRSELKARHVELRRAYCGSLALEAVHLEESQQKDWLFAAIEGLEFAPSPAQRLTVLDDLIRACAFEEFCRKKHGSEKRFGAEGAEGMVPMLNRLIATSAASGCDRAILGGMHRGRLNVLAHVAQKPLSEIFSRFLDLPQAEDRLGLNGDVVYHVGHHGIGTFDEMEVELSLLPHPSHLLCVAPVALGWARAEQDKRTNTRARVLPLVMHTDAAFSGQGLSSEILQLSGLAGFNVAGAVHLVVNNRIGFTTTEKEGRRTRYCTDIAKAYGIPILHVNGFDPDAIVRCAMIAATYRNTFRSDIVIDFNCFRRRGHNELDEPSFTQPIEYRIGAEQIPVWESYRSQLVKEGIDVQLSDRLSKEYPCVLAASRTVALKRDYSSQTQSIERTVNPSTLGASAEIVHKTGVDFDVLKKLGKGLTSLPKDRDLHRGFIKFQETRASSVSIGDNINWALAEALAFASLMSEGYDVRLCGQDVVRGTFTQRHLKWVDQTTGEDGFVFDQLEGMQGQMEAINSPLSEYGILGFEYGYSLSKPDTLTLWEAQFGDFQNVAQPIIDQFIVSGEQKWAQKSGLVLLLPHGLEGGGPDHSSGRPERFLSSCAGGNITAANCTTPANYFHLLRRQMIDPERRPLVLFSPKQHLRSSACRSELKDFSPGTCFQPIIVDLICTKTAPEFIVFCTGRVFFELISKTKGQNYVVVRLEQLYPLPSDQIADVLRNYPCAACVWLQEEPKNLGPWSFILDRFTTLFDELGDDRRIKYTGRSESASASPGSKRVSQSQSDVYLHEILNLRGNETSQNRLPVSWG